MWKKRKVSDNHSTDEELLCHLDGELSKRDRRQIGAHLDVCWLCRTRRERLENQIRLIATGAQQFGVSPGWFDSTRRRLASLQIEFEREFQAPSRTGGVRVRPWVFACLACVVAAVVGIAVLRLPKAAQPPSAVSVIQNIDRLDARLAGETVHQVFDLEERQIVPKGPARRTRLEVWSDAGSHRFVSKWTETDGSLKFGRWRADNGASFTYSAVSARVLPRAELSEALPAFSSGEPDVEALEAGFQHWLKERPWKAVASLADLSLWERQGATMQVQHLPNGLLRLLVRQEIRGVQVDFVAVMAERDYSLRVQRVRLQTGDRVVEFQLSSELSETPVTLSSAVFYPDRGIPATKLVRTATFSAERPGAAVPKGDEKREPVLQPDVSGLIRRLEAYYVLHEAGACRGAPVTVSEQDGGVRVSEQKPASEIAKSYFSVVAGVSDVMGALSEIRNSNERLSRDVLSDFKPGADRERVRQLLTDADALQALAGGFSRSADRVLPEASIHQLQTMLEGHATSLSKTLAIMSDGAAGSGTSEARGDRERAANEDWRDLAASVVSRARTLATLGSGDVAAVHAQVGELARRVDELTAQSQMELNRDRQSAAMRRSKTGK